MHGLGCMSVIELCLVSAFVCDLSRLVWCWFGAEQVGQSGSKVQTSTLHSGRLQRPALACFCLKQVAACCGMPWEHWTIFSAVLASIGCNQQFSGYHRLQKCISSEKACIFQSRNIDFAFPVQKAVTVLDFALLCVPCSGRAVSPEASRSVPVACETSQARWTAAV